MKMEDPRERLREAYEALEEAENRTRKLGAEALSEGSYEESEHLLALARTLGRLAKRGLEDPKGLDGIPPDRPTRSKTTNGRAPRSGKRDPEFLRRAPDVLVRRAWSRKKRDHYTHAIPIDQVLAVLGACAGRGPGEGFTVDDLTESSEVESANLSQYAVYLALGWFKSLGWVMPAGTRGRYEVSPDLEVEALEECVGGAFAELEMEES